MDGFLGWGGVAWRGVAWRGVAWRGVRVHVVCCSASSASWQLQPHGPGPRQYLSTQSVYVCARAGASAFVCVCARSGTRLFLFVNQRLSRLPSFRPSA